MDNYLDVVLTTRIRFARNIKNNKFPSNMTSRERKTVLEAIKDKLDGKYSVLELSNMDDITKKALVENHSISKELLNSSDTGIIHNEEKGIVVMLNEEDHFRIQAFEKGFNIEKAYANIKEADGIIGNSIEYAYSKDYGYITACPTCIGTGMRVSVMLHLPALEKIHALDRIFSDISNLGITVRGMYGENTNSEGAIYQISNNRTIGITEKEIIERIKQVTDYIVKQERKAREILDTKIEIKDDIMRSYGIVKYAELISKKEAMRVLSNIYLGINLGYIKDITVEKVQNLIENIGINSLRKNLKNDFSREDENMKRAEYIKQNI